MIENNAVFCAFEKAGCKQKYDYAYILRTTFCRTQNKREANFLLVTVVNFIEF